MGSSFLPGELIAAFLWAQLEEAEQITRRRLDLWERYHQLMVGWEKQGFFRLPRVPEECQHNAHMFYVLLPEGIDRKKIIRDLSMKGINAIFHYVPLHSSPYGMTHSRTNGKMTNTESLSSRLIRLPLWLGINMQQQTHVVETLVNSIRGCGTFIPSLLSQ